MPRSKSARDVIPHPVIIRCGRGSGSSSSGLDFAREMLVGLREGHPEPMTVGGDMTPVASVVHGDAALKRLRRKLGGLVSPGFHGERMLDVLEQAVEDADMTVFCDDPRRPGHVLVARRATEIVVDGGGYVRTVRSVHEIVSTWPEVAPDESDVLPASVLKVVETVEVTGAACVRAVSCLRDTSPDVDGEDDGRAVVRLEVHIKGGVGVPKETVTQVLDVLGSYTETRRQIALRSGGGPVRASGPYVSGDWFRPDDAPLLGDDAGGMALRGLLREVGLVAGGVLPAEFPGHGAAVDPGTTEGAVARRADAALDRRLPSMALPPEYGTPDHVFGTDREDPREFVAYVFDPDEIEDGTMLQVLRTLDVVWSAGSPVFELKVRVVRTLALDHAGAHVLRRAVELVLDQAFEDVTALVPGLSRSRGVMDVRVELPGRMLGCADDLLADFRTGIADVARQAIDPEDGIRLTVVPVEPEPPVGHGGPVRPLTEVSLTPGRLDVELMTVSAIKQLVDTFGEEDLEGFDLLRADHDGKPTWVDADECEGEETREAFVMGRAWYDGTPMPMVFHVGSGEFVDVDPEGLLVSAAAGLHARDAEEPDWSEDGLRTLEDMAAMTASWIPGVSVHVADTRSVIPGCADRRVRISTVGDPDLEARVIGQDATGSPLVTAHTLPVCVPLDGRGRVRGGRHAGFLVACHVGDAAMSLLDGTVDHELIDVEVTRMFARAVASIYLDEVSGGKVHGARSRLRALLGRIMRIPEAADETVVRKLRAFRTGVPDACLYLVVAVVADVVETVLAEHT